MRLSAMLVASAVLVAATPALAAAVDVPVDIGVGPAAYFITGPVYADQPVHFGLKLSVEAIIDRELIRREQNRIPRQYRNMALRMNEVRISPSIFIPDSLFISPKIQNTAIYGVTWRPIAAGFPIFSGPVSLGLDAGLVLTGFYLYSTTLPNTVFVRPGIDVKAELEIMPSRHFGISLGWDSGFYIPERLGTFLSVTPIDEGIWHIGQAFLKLHFRFEQRVRL